mgnify:CR=1 FL=1
MHWEIVGHDAVHGVFVSPGWIASFLHAILTHQQENFSIVFELWRIFYCLLSFFTRIKISGELLT